MLFVYININNIQLELVSLVYFFTLFCTQKIIFVSNDFVITLENRHKLVGQSFGKQTNTCCSAYFSEKNRGV